MDCFSDFFKYPNWWLLQKSKTLISSWSEPAATSAPIQDDAIQAILGMNQKHILFPCPGIFQAPSLPQNFLFLRTPPPLWPTSPLLPPSSHFPRIPSSELERAPELE